VPFTVWAEAAEKGAKKVSTSRDTRTLFINFTLLQHVLFGLSEEGRPAGKQRDDDVGNFHPIAGG
jgi:hypothetical protein